MLSLRGYAKHRKESGLPGGTLTAVQKALASGRIRAKNGQIEPTQADRDWLSNSDQRRQRQRRPDNNAEPDEVTVPNDGSFQEAQRQREWERLRRERTARRVREGELVEVAEVREAWCEIASRIRDGVMGLPTRVCIRLPAEWRRKISDTLTEEARKVLAAMGESIRNRASNSEAATVSIVDRK